MFVITLYIGNKHHINVNAMTTYDCLIEFRNYQLLYRSNSSEVINQTNNGCNKHLNILQVQISQNLTWVITMVNNCYCQSRFLSHKWWYETLEKSKNIRMHICIFIVVYVFTKFNAKCHRKQKIIFNFITKFVQ